VEITDYFESVNGVVPGLGLMSIDDCLFSQVQFCTDIKSSEELVGFDVAIIGISDGKNACNNEGVSDAAEVVRPILYSLKRTSRKLKIVDLGNIKGKTINDRYFVIKEICQFLKKNNIVGIFLGGGQDYTFPMAKSFVSERNFINLCIIDYKVDAIADEFSSKSFVSIIKDELSDGIIELNLLGGQNYFIGNAQEVIFYNESWDIVRLKDLRGEGIIQSEPYLRDANIVSFDVGAIQCDFMPYYTSLNVNGFTGYEACQMAWYSGMSNELKVFSLNEYNPQIDKTGKGAIIYSEIIWHVLEGVSSKSIDVPSEESEIYKIFIVHLHNFNQDIRFYNNRYNQRWWIEVPWKEGVRLVSCSEKLYQDTQKGELPEKWWKYFQKGACDY